jgi:hypothetical protein
VSTPNKRSAITAFEFAMNRLAYTMNAQSRVEAKIILAPAIRSVVDAKIMLWKIR